MPEATRSTGGRPTTHQKAGNLILLPEASLISCTGPLVVFNGPSNVTKRQPTTFPTGVHVTNHHHWERNRAAPLGRSYFYIEPDVAGPRYGGIRLVSVQQNIKKDS